MDNSQPENKQNVYLINLLSPIYSICPNVVRRKRFNVCSDTDIIRAAGQYSLFLFNLCCISTQSHSKMHYNYVGPQPKMHLAYIMGPYIVLQFYFFLPILFPLLRVLGWRIKHIAALNDQLSVETLTRRLNPGLLTSSLIIILPGHIHINLQ